MTNLPLIIYSDIADKELYKKLQNYCPYFTKATNTELFIFAASVGVKYDLRNKIKSRDSYTRTEYLKSEDHAIIKALAISTEGIDILNEPAKLVEVIEEYAHGGINKIANIIDDKNTGSFDKIFELEINSTVDLLIADPI